MYKSKQTLLNSNIGRVRCRGARAVAISSLFIVLLMSLLSAKQVPAQEKLLDLLPYQEGIYLWSNDVPALIEQVKVLAPTNVESWQSVFNQADDSKSNDSEIPEIFAKHRLIQLQSLGAIWEQLDEDKIFDGEAALILRKDSNQDLQDLFAARSSAARSEVESFVESIRKLASKAKREGDERGKDNKGLVEWRYENGWFYLSSSPALLDEVEKYLSHDGKAELPVADNRTFRLTFGSLQSERQIEPAVEVYVTAGAMPLVLEWCPSLSDSLLELNPRYWDSDYVKAFRGIGARFFLNESKLQNKANAVIGMDAFIVVAQPRHGVIRGFGRQDMVIKIEDEIAPFEPIRQLSILQIDGVGLRQGMIEASLTAARRRQIADLDELRISLESDAEYQLFEEFETISSVQLNSAESKYRAFRTWASARVADRVRFDELLKEGDYQALEIRKLSSFGDPYQAFARDDAVGWAPTQESIDEKIASKQRQIEVTSARIAELESKNDDTGMTVVPLSSFRGSLLRYKEELEKLYEPLRPELIAVGDFIYPDSMDEEFISSMHYALEHRHPQLEQLREDLANIRDALGSPPPNAAVFAFWGDRAANNRSKPESLVGFTDEEYALAMRAAMGTPEEQKANAERQRLLKLEKEQKEELTELLLRQVDRVVVSASTNENGFRFHGILIQDKTGEPDEEIKADSK